MAKLPKYAQGVEPNHLVSILCRGKCGKSRYARANLAAYKSTEMDDPENYATCLMCGYRAIDPYNWLKP